MPQFQPRTGASMQRAEQRLRHSRWGEPSLSAVHVWAAVAAAAGLILWAVLGA